MQGAVIKVTCDDPLARNCGNSVILDPGSARKNLRIGGMFVGEMLMNAKGAITVMDICQPCLALVPELHYGLSPHDREVLKSLGDGT